MVIDNLTSGLIGAVVGSVLGVAGAFAIQWWQNRRDDQAAARATHMEVVANGVGLEFAIEHGVYAPLSTSTWAAARLRLARRLSPGEFLEVARYYATIEAIDGAGYPTSGGPSRGLVSVAQVAFERAAQVAPILERRGWSKGDRRLLEEKVQGPPD